MSRVSTLPGTTFTATAGAVCDNHPERESVKRVQGETDSFGAEFHELCQECYNQFKEAVTEGRRGSCDWCRKEASLKPTRDLEEGSAGPVYYCCEECRGAMYRSIAEQMQ